MNPLTEAELRGCFVNASLRERQNLTLPIAYHDVVWSDLDFLGWRDTKAPKLGYVVTEIDGEPIGLLLRETDARARSRPQCSWCADITLPNDVVLYSAKRAGDAGRNGDTVGILACANFECSVNVRRRQSVAYVGFDVEAAKLHRIEMLRTNVDRFVRAVLG